MKMKLSLTAAATLQVVVISALCNWSLLVVINGFSRPIETTVRRYSSSSYTLENDVTRSSSSSSPSLLQAGFGGGGKLASSSSTKKGKKSAAKKEIKLKPKQQWDRYVELKNEAGVAVAIRLLVDDDGADDWLEVGSVKSQDSKYIDQAVFRQRALIAEHAKRLYPGKLNKKQQQQFQLGYYKSDDGDEGEWVVVDKSSVSTPEVEGLVKRIGFMGRPDPITGFYTEESVRGMNANFLGLKSKTGGPITGSNKKGPGDGVI